MVTQQEMEGLEQAELHIGIKPTSIKHVVKRTAEPEPAEPEPAEPEPAEVEYDEEGKRFIGQ